MLAEFSCEQGVHVIRMFILIKYVCRQEYLCLKSVHLNIGFGMSGCSCEQDVSDVRMFIG